MYKKCPRADYFLCGRHKSKVSILPVIGKYLQTNTAAKIDFAEQPLAWLLSAVSH
jgi:hypothetical protein